MNAWVMIGMWLALAAGLGAEEIGLRDGRKIEGEVIRHTTGEIVVKSASGVATFKLIELDDTTVRRFLGPVTNPAVEAAAVEASKPQDAEALIARIALQAGILWTIAKVLGFVAWVWWIVAGFRASIWWGIALLLFQPCANVFLVIFQWDHARWPFFLSLLTCVLIAAPALLMLA